MKTIPLNIHTHRMCAENGTQAIVSLSIGNSSPFPIEKLIQCPNTLFSIGLHPWDVDIHWQKLIEEKLMPYIEHPQVIAIGEVGLDRMRGGEWTLQMAAFTHQARLAAQTGKPLIVHCVKAFDEIIHSHKESFSHEKWIIHGFRGKKEQAAQLLHHGFYLSFGEHFHEEALQSCPSDRLFIETDECDTPIQELYRRAALLRKTEMKDLTAQIQDNVLKTFPFIQTM